MCCLGALGGCLGSMCVGCCCTSLQGCNVKHGPASRIPYIFLTFIFSIFAVFMSLYGEKAIFSNDMLDVSLSVCNSTSCKGNGSVYRTSFALFIFFIVHAFLVYFIMAFHWLFFGIKFLILAAFVAFTFWIPNSVFDGYADFARVASVVFLVLQVIVLISWAWDINDCIVNKVNKAQDNEIENETNYNLKGYQCLLVFLTLILYVAIILGWVFFFQWFYGDSSCSFNQIIIIVSIILVILATILPLILQTGSIFTTAVVSFYMTYLCYAGLSNYPHEECNPFLNERNTGSLWIGIVISAAAIAYTGFSVSKQNLLSSNANQIADNDDDDNEVDLETSKDNKDKTKEDCDDNTKNVNKSNYDDVENPKSTVPVQSSEDAKCKIEQKVNVWFHLCMAFSAIYMCMLYTNWGTNVSSTAKASARGRISIWVNIGAQWVTFVLYIWTVVAPKVCPQRFGIVNDE